MKIELLNVEKNFKNENVLKNINLSFESGNIYGFYGKNGSGKSVLLKLISGIYKPTSGEILYDYKKLDYFNDFPENIAALIENPTFFPELTGFQNLKILSEIKNEIDDSKINDILELVNLKDEKDKIYSKYSLGMKQKLGIAQALMEENNFILLDEPFNALDDVTVSKLKKYFYKLKKEGKSIIISSHDKDDLIELCDKIYYFDKGTVTKCDLIK